MAVKTGAFGAAGTTLSNKTGASTVFVPLAQLVDMEEGGIATDDIDTTLLASTVKTFTPSIPDPGDLTLTVYNVPGDAGVASLKAQALAPVMGIWQIQYPDGSSPTTGTTEVFSGYVNGFAPKGFAIGGTPTADVTIKISGTIVTTTGS